MPTIYIVRADGSQLRQLTTSPFGQVVPSWSADGRSVYYASNETGSWQVWRQDVNGGAPSQVTKRGGFAAFESADGKWVYYAKGNATRGIWRVPVQGSEETPVLDALPPAMWGNWALRPDGIYFLDSTFLAVLLGCGLRRSECAALTFGHVQQRDGRWYIVDLVGKHGRVRTITIGGRSR
jgi:WD40-like Beta Propeller Repeat